MPLYECSICHAAENTALTNFWEDLMYKRPPLCSECDPRIGKWHERFPKITAEEYNAKFPEHHVEYRLSGRSILEREACLLRTKYFEPLLESSPPPLTHLESTDIPVANDKARQEADGVMEHMELEPNKSNSPPGNPAWILLEALRRAGWVEDEILISSFTAAADYCDGEARSIVEQIKQRRATESGKPSS